MKLQLTFADIIKNTCPVAVFMADFRLVMWYTGFRLVLYGLV